MSDRSMPEQSMERWRGEVDAFMRQSAADRAILHSEVARAEERGEARHRELIAAIRESAEAHSRAVDGLSKAISVERARIDRWEARAEGATWSAKWLPHSITALLSAVATYVATGKWPPN